MLLIVDDDAAIRELLAQFLVLNGHIVDTAIHGRHALELLKRAVKPPKLILLDLVMPVLDGWGFLLERSKDPGLLMIPVLVMSATPGITAKAKAAGAHTVLRKPFSPKDLLPVIEHFATAA
jgi:two-component system, chemotaxis family, chemotaxis protein CheY